jgi:molecular chaperone HscB
MNYFELFELEPTLKPDPAELRKKFFALSRKFHPDYHIQNDADNQQVALETSAVLNRAYKTLGNEQETIKYLLGWKGLLQENEKYALPPDFLMEMLELNEEAADAGDAAGKEKLREKIKQAEHGIYVPVQNIIENYREGVTSETELMQVKDYYFKKKYLERLQQQLL